MVTAKTFLASIGVNTHMDATNTGYGNVSLVADALAYLGISSIRDHAYDIDIPAFQQLGQGGVRLDLIVDTDTQHELDTMQPVAGLIDTFEGSNEVDWWTVTMPGARGPVASAVAAQKALFQDAHAIPAFAGIPIINDSLAFATDFAKYSGALSYADIANSHLYAGNGDTPQTYIVPTIASEIATTSKPMVETETGYYTLLNNPTDPSGVSLTVQAEMTLDELFDNLTAGVSKTYLYELLDEGSDPQANDREMHYGLFFQDGSPKPVATALHNLSAILSLSGSSASGSISLTPTVSGLPATGRVTTLAGQNGTEFVVVWAEPQVWDQFTQHDLPKTSVPITVQLGQAVRSVSVYDPLVGTTPIAAQTQATSVSLTLTDHPLILLLAPAANPATPTGTPAPITSQTVSWHDNTTGAAGVDAADTTGGSAASYQWYKPDDVDLSANGANVSLVGGSGTDALVAHAGSNVLDGGAGSSFLVGSAGGDGGTDQFFVDLRGTDPTWSTVVNFHHGDTITLWGFQSGTSTETWSANEGAPGYLGATLHSELAGSGTGVTASLTLAGLQVGDAETKLSTSSGTANGTAFLKLSYTG